MNEYKRLSEADLDKLTRAVFGLLPQGNLFHLDESSNLFKFVKYIADNARGDLTYMSDKLMDEMNPARTNILLDDWIEAAFAFDSGDECITRDELNLQTDEEKRRILIARLLENGRVDRDYIERILNIWVDRTDIRAYEFFPSRLDVMETNDTINESTWVFVDSGALRIGERFIHENRTKPSWMAEYDIYGFSTLENNNYGIWSNVEEWKELEPTFSGDVQWNAGESNFRLGEDGVITLPTQIQDRYGNGQGVIIGGNFYSTVSSNELFIDTQSAFTDQARRFYLQDHNGAYRYVYDNQFNPAALRININRELWEGAMIYAGGNSQRLDYFINSQRALRIGIASTRLSLEGDIRIGANNRSGPLYVREVYVLIEKAPFGIHEGNVSRDGVAREVSSPNRKFDNILDSPFYDSTFELIDGETTAEDLKTFELIKCILRRILPLSVEYSSGKAI